MNWTPTPRGHYVLVADGHSLRGRSLAGDLRAQGCYASSTAGGRDALRYVAENEPDVVVCDWELPDMSGADLAREIRSGSADTRVILLKDAADWRILREAFECGADDLLARPFSVGSLLGAVRRILGHRLPALQSS